jgi:hypothetical protein
MVCVERRSVENEGDGEFKFEINGKYEIQIFTRSFKLTQILKHHKLFFEFNLIPQSMIASIKSDRILMFFDFM